MRHGEGGVSGSVWGSRRRSETPTRPAGASSKRGSENTVMGEKVRRGDGQLAMMHDTSISPRWSEGETRRNYGICQGESPGRFQSSHRFEPRNPSYHTKRKSLHAGLNGYPLADTLDTAQSNPHYCHEASHLPSDARTPSDPPPASPPFHRK